MIRLSPARAKPRFHSSDRSRATPGRRAAFSMIEMMGVIAIIAVLAGVITPPLVRRMSTMNGQKEEARLDIIADGLVAYLQAKQLIPGAGTWVTNVSSVTGQSLNEVKRVNPADANTARVYLIHPSFTPADIGPGGFADPLWTQTASGAAGVANDRILIVSSQNPNLTLPVSSGKAASSAAFDAIWNWSYDPKTEAPPSGWPAAWLGNAEYLHVKRLNLASQFQSVTFNNLEVGVTFPYYQIGSSALAPMNSGAAFASMFLRNTLISLYEADSTTLDLELFLSGAANLIYEADQWRVR